VANAPGFGGEQPHHAVISQWADGVYKAINKIAIVIAPPHDHNVNNVVEIFIHHFGADDGFDALAKLLIHVRVIAEFLNRMTRLKA
jgi:hypothetical protein